MVRNGSLTKKPSNPHGSMASPKLTNLEIEEQSTPPILPGSGRSSSESSITSKSGCYEKPAMPEFNSDVCQSSASASADIGRCLKTQLAPLF